MMKRSLAVTAVYVAGMLSLVPYSVWYLLFRAPRDEYAFWISLAVGWTFLYFPIVMPVLIILRFRCIMRNLERYRSLEDLVRGSGLTEEDVVRMVAKDNGLPRFVVRPLVRRIIAALAARMSQAQGTTPKGAGGGDRG